MSSTTPNNTIKRSRTRVPGIAPPAVVAGARILQAGNQPSRGQASHSESAPPSMTSLASGPTMIGVVGSEFSSTARQEPSRESEVESAGSGSANRLTHQFPLPPASGLRLGPVASAGQRAPPQSVPVTPTSQNTGIPAGSESQSAAISFVDLPYIAGVHVPQGTTPHSRSRVLSRASTLDADAYGLRAIRSFGSPPPLPIRPSLSSPALAEWGSGDESSEASSPSSPSSPSSHSIHINRRGIVEHHIRDTTTFDGLRCRSPLNDGASLNEDRRIRSDETYLEQFGHRAPHTEQDIIAAGPHRGFFATPVHRPTVIVDSNAQVLTDLTTSDKVLETPSPDGGVSTNEGRDSLSGYFTPESTHRDPSFKSSSPDQRTPSPSPPDSTITSPPPSASNFPSQIASDQDAPEAPRTSSSAHRSLQSKDRLSIHSDIPVINTEDPPSPADTTLARSDPNLDNASISATPTEAGDGKTFLDRLQPLLKNILILKSESKEYDDSVDVGKAKGKEKGKKKGKGKEKAKAGGGGLKSLLNDNNAGAVANRIHSLLLPAPVLPVSRSSSASTSASPAPGTSGVHAPTAFMKTLHLIPNRPTEALDDLTRPYPFSRPGLRTSQSEAALNRFAFVYQGSATDDHGPECQDLDDTLARILDPLFWKGAAFITAFLRPNQQLAPLAATSIQDQQVPSEEELDTRESMFIGELLAHIRSASAHLAETSSGSQGRSLEGR